MAKRKRNRQKDTTPKKPLPDEEPTRKSARLSKCLSKKTPVKSDESETSPFKGFNTSADKSLAHSSGSKISPLKGFNNENKSTVQSPSIDPFDALKGDGFESHFSRNNLKTYVNKKKREQPEIRPFQDMTNRTKIIEWLHDNRNNFDRLTQTQGDVFECTQAQTQKVPLDLDSISQIDPSVNEDCSKRLTRQSPYRLRARSLDVKQAKNLSRDRSRHSVAGESVNLDDYCIENCDSVPVDTKTIFSQMADEYLDNIEMRIKQNAGKNGWDDIKEIKKIVRAKKVPKRLDITLQSTQNSAVKTQNLSNKCEKTGFDLNFFESAVQNLGEIATSSSESELSECQKNIMTTGNKLKLLLTNLSDEETKLKLVPYVRELQNTLKTFLNQSELTEEKGTQTLSIPILKQGVQVQPFMLDKEMQSELLQTGEKNVQTISLPSLNQEVQVQPLLIGKEIQTDLENAAMKREKSDRSTPDILVPDSEQPKEESQGLHETLDDFEFETEKFLPTNHEKPVTPAEIEAIQDVPRQNTVENNNIPIGSPSGMVCEMNTIIELGMKRRMVEDDSVQANKRPCSKFIDDDASVYFESGNQMEISAVPETDQQEQIEEGFTDGDDDLLVAEIEKIEQNARTSRTECTPMSGFTENLAVLEQIDILEKARDEQKVPEKSAEKSVQNSRDTQELMNACDMLIYNATRVEPKNVPVLQTTSQAKSPEVDDIAYFNTTLDPPKTVRKNLFPPDKYSDSLFSSTMKPLEQSERNIDSIFEEINKDNVAEEEEDDDYKFDPYPKVRILQNIVIGEPDEVLSISSEDVDVVEDTPTKCTTIRRTATELPTAAIPPPMEFQDSLPEFDLTAIEKNHSFVIPNKKVTSTPCTNQPESEPISLSPISRLSSVKTPLNPIELAQKAKFSPLTIVKKSQSQMRAFTPKSSKQNSILNYVSFEAKNQELPCIAWTRIPTPQIMKISAMANKKLCTHSSVFSSKVTHVIVSIDDNRKVKEHTVKYISAVAAGKWVLGFDWIEACLTQNCLVPEEPYEVKDFNGVDGPRQSRLNGRKKPLLKGFRIYVAPPLVTASEADLHNIIKMVGGKVASSAEELLDKNGDICVIIAESQQTQDIDIYDVWLTALRVVSVDIEWLTRSIGNFRVLSLRHFTLCADEVENLNYPAYLLDETDTFP